MVVQIKRMPLALLLAMVLILTACHKTVVPDSHRSDRSSVGTYSNSTYIVRKGDTLYSIGKRFGVDHRLLARRNHIGWPYTIYVGQELSLTRIAPRAQYIPVPKSTPSKSALPKSSSTTSRAKSTTTKSHSVEKKPSTPNYDAPAVNGVASSRLRWPVTGMVTSQFGRRGSRMHDGIDIDADEGTPVHAASSGEVVYADQRLSGYGKMIIIRHNNDLFTAYAHNQRNLVSKGDKVKSGDVIARVGKTGRATGAHLHFEVRRGSTPVDPLAYLPKR